LRDLKAAKSFGLKTIYVKRPQEGGDPTAEDERYIDMIVDDLIDAARKLGMTS